jgi:hypothetical protein
MKSPPYGEQSPYGPGGGCAENCLLMLKGHQRR